MLPLKLRLKDIGPYEDETVDFSQVPGNVIAIVGENGAGKTMLMDSIFAALYRYFPSRDSIYKYCRGKKAGIEFEFSDGMLKYRTEVKINAVSREMESWLFAIDGETLQPLTDGKNSTFDKEIAKRFGSPEVVLASVYASQNKAGSFATLAKAKRKELFINMLGLSKLQAVSDQAAVRERDSKEAYDRLFSKAEAYREVAFRDTPDMEEMETKLALARAIVQTKNEIARQDDVEVALLQAKVKSVSEIEDRQFPIRKRKQGIEKQIDEIGRALKDAEALSGDIDKIRGEAESYNEINSKLSQLRSKFEVLSNQQSDYHRRVSQYNQVVRELEKQKQEAQGIVNTVGIKLSRAGSDSSIVSTVPCQGVGECAECQFLVNAIKARDSISDMEAQIDNATAQVLLLESQIKATPKPDPQQLSIVSVGLESTSQQIKSLEVDLVSANNARSRLVLAEAAEGNIRDFKSRLESLRGDHSVATSELDELESTIKETKKLEGNLKQALQKAESNRELAKQAQQALSECLAAASKAEAEREMSRQAEAELNKITPVLARLDQDRKSWNLLVRAFGKTGIQSLEIDAAGPTVSEIVNDLLFSCFGPRFSIRFVTQVIKDDKSGYKDDFDIYVTDSNTGREGSIDDLSGGEKVIICEAVSLAIALFNRDRSNVGWLSLWRDEASSAIDDQRAPQYIRMLQSAREQGHFEKLFFIAHQKRVTEGADSKLIVDSGHVSFE